MSQCSEGLSEGGVRVEESEFVSRGCIKVNTLVNGLRKLGCVKG